MLRLSVFQPDIYAECKYIVFFFNDTATTEIYTLSLHDALPISSGLEDNAARLACPVGRAGALRTSSSQDRKSTRLNSSHITISYAVFCLKKKKKKEKLTTKPAVITTQ